MEAQAEVATDVGEGHNVDNLRATLRAANFGEFMSVLLQSERHKDLTLGTLMQRVVPAFLADQYVLARAVPDRDGAPGTPIGIAFWASVSEDVAGRLSNSKAGSIDIAPKEWTSGEIIVVLDVVASRLIADQLIKKIRQKVGPKQQIVRLASREEGRAALEAV